MGHSPQFNPQRESSWLFRSKPFIISYLRSLRPAQISALSHADTLQVTTSPSTLLPDTDHSPLSGT